MPITSSAPSNGSTRGYARSVRASTPLLPGAADTLKRPRRGTGVGWHPSGQSHPPLPTRTLETVNHQLALGKAGKACLA